jgi:hypothetical protein
MVIFVGVKYRSPACGIEAVPKEPTPKIIRLQLFVRPVAPLRSKQMSILHLLLLPEQKQGTAFIIRKLAGAD